MAAKQKQTAAKIELTYLIEIEDWCWRYSFSAIGDRFTGDSHTEFRNLHMTGRLLHPKDMKGECAEIIIMPDKRYNEGLRETAPIPSVGQIYLTGNSIQVCLDLPDDALAPVISALGAGVVRFATFRGEKPRYRKARIHDYSLDQTYDEDDL